MHHGRLRQQLDSIQICGKFPDIYLLLVVDDSTGPLFCQCWHLQRASHGILAHNSFYDTVKQQCRHYSQMRGSPSTPPRYAFFSPISKCNLFTFLFFSHFSCTIPLFYQAAFSSHLDTTTKPNVSTVSEQFAIWHCNFFFYMSLTQT